MVDWRRPILGVGNVLRGAMQTYSQRGFSPVPRRDDDLFLVEFPKSGGTWLTFLVANTNALLSGDQRKITFFNINDFVPAVETMRHLGAPLLPMPGYRCFRSHSPYIQRYRKVIYLVRDPRHVMVSYCIFLNKLGWWNGTLEQLIRHRHFGIRAWSNHVSGWLDGAGSAAAFTLIRYEDLLANTAVQLQRLCELQGLPVDNDLVLAAVERSSVENMRASEASLNQGHPAFKDFEFVRRSQIGGARQELPEELRKLIEGEAAPVMKRLGYGPLGA